MSEEYRFPGFKAPHYTQVPDELFDELLAKGLLTESELRVLLYIIRRTFGWKKDFDAISLGQMADGIVRKDGSRVDHGAGLDRSAASRAVKKLEAKGIITATRTSTAEHGNGITVYSLHMAGGEVPKDNRGVAKTQQGGRQNTNALVAKTHPQETTVQETIKQESVAATISVIDDEPVPVEQEPDTSEEEPQDVAYSPVLGEAVKTYCDQAAHGGNIMSNVRKAHILRNRWPSEESFLAALRVVWNTMRRKDMMAFWAEVERRSPA